MLVQPLSALLLTLSNANTAPPTRAIEPTEAELAQFQLSPKQDYFDGYGKTPAFQVSGVGIFAASAADLLTTEYGLSRGYREGNPAASNRGLRVVTHVVGPAAVYYATEKLQREGKTKTALFLRVSLMVAYSYAAVHNARLMGASP
jgi:hypothetical protein